MIILDTHILVWWIHGDDRISSSQSEIIKANETDVIGVSAISIREIAKLVEYNRLELPCPCTSGSARHWLTLVIA